MTTAKASPKHGAPAPRASNAGERPLPNDRASLLELHQELRHRRDRLPLLSEERAETIIEIARVEVQIAAIERAMDPPQL
jgi:hypothetical protein